MSPSRSGVGRQSSLQMTAPCSRMCCRHGHSLPQPQLRFHSCSCWRRGLRSSAQKSCNGDSQWRVIGARRQGEAASAGLRPRCLSGGSLRSAVCPAAGPIQQCAAPQGPMAWARPWAPAFAVLRAVQHGAAPPARGIAWATQNPVSHRCTPTRAQRPARAAQLALQRHLLRLRRHVSARRGTRRAPRFICWALRPWRPSGWRHRLCHVSSGTAIGRAAAAAATTTAAIATVVASAASVAAVVTIEHGDVACLRASERDRGDRLPLTAMRLLLNRSRATRPRA